MLSNGGLPTRDRGGLFPKDATERKPLMPPLPAESPSGSGPEPEDVATRIRDAAIALGFARVGFVPVERFDEADRRLQTWLEAGHHGHMAYLANGDDRAEPRALLDNARTVISVALPYRGASSVALRRDRDATTPLVGSVAAYAVGTDYHRVLKDKLWALGRACKAILGRPVAARACVDTAPMLEREAARRGGLGFIGKSTMAIVPGVGTYVLLGELLVDVEIAPDHVEVRAGCGRCTACLDACPSGAFVGPYVLDARRCVSYLTIETRGAIPVELRSAVGARVFGCDVCQDVCPFNGSESPRPAAPELAAHPALDQPSLVGLLELTSTGYRKLVRRTALRRVGRPQLQRNAAVALGNSGSPDAVAPLARALEHDKSPLVRGHAAWALGQLGGETARGALARALATDTDESVRDEARAALQKAPAS
jgi:epoxyqueuosine reductase